ncbi:MAG: FKBP-type peptidyl-prolyl cis-trans isomerase [Candidatus Undinarchaeales archaeon]
MDKKDLENKSYRELQKLAKKKGIKANQKKKTLIKKLSGSTGSVKTIEKTSEKASGISVFETINDIKKSLAILGFVGILIVVAFIGLTYAPNQVEEGDNVTMKYTLYDENYDVLETNEMTFVVGEGQIVSGLEQGIIGMSKGKTDTIEVPPELGYGAYDPTNIKIVQEEVEIARSDSAALSTLETVTDEEIEAGAKISINTLPWKISIFSIEEIEQDGQTLQEVTYKHDPVNGSLYTDPLLLPWPIKVTSINETKVVYKNTPDIGTQVVSNGRVGTVSKIEDGQVVVDFNHEMAGETLIFKVKILDIEKTE